RYVVHRLQTGRLAVAVALLRPRRRRHARRVLLAVAAEGDEEGVGDVVGVRGAAAGGDLLQGLVREPVLRTEALLLRVGAEPGDVACEVARRDVGDARSVEG